MFDTISCHKATGSDQVLFKKEMDYPVDHHQVRINAMDALIKVILLVLPVIFLTIDKTTAAHSLPSTVEGTYHSVEALRMVLLGIGMLIFASFLRAQVNQKTMIHFLRSHQ